MTCEGVLFTDAGGGCCDVGAKVPGGLLQEWANSEGSRGELPRLPGAKQNQWLQRWSGSRSDALSTAKHGNAVGPDALPAEVLKAGGTCLLPHLPRLAAPAMMAGVPKGWR